MNAIEMFLSLLRAGVTEARLRKTIDRKVKKLCRKLPLAAQTIRTGGLAAHNQLDLAVAAYNTKGAK